MVDFAPVQEAVDLALSGVSGGPYPVYDAVPVGEGDELPLPYIGLGKVTQVPGEEISELGATATIDIHVWSGVHGKYEAQEMLQYAREQLNHQDIGGGVWMIYEEGNDVFEDPTSTADNRLFHGIARYRIRFN